MLRFNQWCIANPLDKVPKNINGVNISVHQRDQMVDYDTAKHWADKRGWVVGFILTNDDPFTCIDLDIKDDLSEEEYNSRTARFEKIIREFDSYSELSLSGKGVHIWVMGDIGPGRRRDGVEVYSRERFIICTGQVIVNKGIEDRQELLEELISRMGIVEPTMDLIELDEEESDAWVYETAKAAINGEKFDQLCQGNWKQYGYPSQSEADLALMSMFTFYSVSNEQCRRLFRYTKLGERDKAQNDAYLNRMLKTIRYRQKLDADNAIAGEMTAKLLVQKSQANVVNNAPAVIVDNGDEFPWPPGFAGHLARNFFINSPRPFRESAIVSVLGLLSGICGKSWNVSNTGLNGYYVLIAQSGVGKESLFSNLSRVVSEMRAQGKFYIQPFVDFSEYMSPQALTKGLLDNPCFVNPMREFGKTLVDMSSNRPSEQAVKIKNLMTKLYSMSGSETMMGGLKYSNSDDSMTGTDSSVSFSMVGETTPKTFFNCLSDTMMEDGFLSRFVLFDYKGLRVPLNDGPKTPIPQDILDQLGVLGFVASDYIQRKIIAGVQIEPNAKIFLDKYNDKCDREINKTDDDFYRQIWNRAHLKVMRIAALLAVFDNPYNPVIGLDQVNWAHHVVNNNFHIFDSKYAAGEIRPQESHSRVLIVKTGLKHYLELSPDTRRSRNVSAIEHRQGLITRTYIFNYICKVSAFTKSPQGATRTIDETIKELLDSGNLEEISALDTNTRGRYKGRLFRIISLD